MDAIEFQTSAGRFALVGRLRLEAGRPAVVAINGSFPNKDYLHDLVDEFPDASVFVAYLPGMWGTRWEGAALDDLAAAFNGVLDRLVGDAPIVLMAASTGNLLGFALERPTVVRRIAVEPFFQTRDLWPFIDFAQNYMSRRPQEDSTRAYLWDLFGIGPDRVENRDYRHLLQRIRTPTDVLVGQLPLLPRRDMRGWPSLTPVEDRAALAALPAVTLQEGVPGTGHGVNVTGPGAALVKDLIRQALRDVAATI